jgi:hypothetical protein
MNILNRLKKIEKDNPNKPACFCGKTLLDLWYGDADADALTYCSNCKGEFDYWQNLAREAASNQSKNLTDIEIL